MSVDRLDEGGVRVVAGMLEGAMADIVVGIDWEKAADVILELFQAVDAFAGPAGLYEMAVLCSRRIVGRAHPDAGRLSFVGHGVDELSAFPDTPARYRVARFATAVAVDDWATAGGVWEQIAPVSDGEDPSQDFADFLNMLFQAAWMRTAGGTTRIDWMKSSRWPPPCDFCTAKGAAFMWQTNLTAASAPDPGGFGGAVESHFADTRWYACRVCEPLIARAVPDWARVLARHLHHRPHAGQQGVMGMYLAFQRGRHGVRSRPLPRRRPTS